MKRFTFLMALLILMLASGAYADQATFTGVKIEDDGDMVFDSGIGITMGGEKKTSWGSVVSPMTDASGYVYPTDAGSKLKLHDTGEITLGGAVATDVDINWDGNAVDMSVGLYDTDDNLQIRYGTTPGTDTRLAVKGSGTETRIMVGDDVNEENKSIIFKGNARDYYIAYTDASGGSTNDTLTFGVGNDVGAIPVMYLPNSTSSPKLFVFHGVDGVGAVDMDYGSADITDHTFTTDGGAIVIDGNVTFPNSEVFKNLVNGTLTASSDTGDFIFEVYSPNTSDGDASVRLTADAGTDAGDIMQFLHDGATNSIFVQSDTASKGTPATVATIAKTGIITTTNYIDNEISDTNNTSTVDVARFTHLVTNTAGTNIGVGTLFRLEDGSGNEDTAGSIDVVHTTATHGSEDSDFLFSQLSAGTEQECLRLVAASGDTAASYLQYTAGTNEDNGVVDVMRLKSAISGAGANNFGMGVSVYGENTGDTSIEIASIDFVETTATAGSEMTDVVVNQNISHAVQESLRLVAASSATTANKFRTTHYTSETNGVVDIAEFKLGTSGTALANLGEGFSFQVEDGGGTTAEVASMDIQLNTVTANQEDADIIFSQATNGAVMETLKLVAASSTTTSDYLKYTANTGETNAVVDIAQLRLSTAPSAATNDLGAGVSIQIEDAGGNVAEAASIDFQYNTATDGQEDADIIFSQVTFGTVSETLKLIAASSATTSDKLRYTANTSETNGTVDIAEFRLSTAGTATTNLGAGISIHAENGSGTIEEMASIDVVETTATGTAEMADVIVNQNIKGTVVEALRLVAASSATAANKIRTTHYTAETNDIVDVAEIKLGTSGTALASLGAGISIQVEEGGGTTEEAASIDVQYNTVTDEQEDADVIVRQRTNGTVMETLKLVAASSTTTSDYLQYTANTGETNASMDTVVLKLDSTGTPAKNLGLGISVQIDDATPGVEEQASVDFVLADASNGSEDCDIIVSQNVAGTITPTLKLESTANGGLGYRVLTEVATTNDTLTVEESGKHVVCNPASSSVNVMKITLPTGQVGLIYTVTAYSADTISVDVAGTDTILYVGASAGESIASAGASSDSITLYCPVANTWVIESSQGTWSWEGA